MAKPAYRPGPRTGGIVLFAAFAMSAMWVGALPVLGLVLGPAFVEKWVVPVFVLPPFIAFIPCWLICRSVNRRRRVSLERVLPGLGFQALMEPTEADKEALWGEIGHLADLLNLVGGATKVRWLARQMQAEGTGATASATAAWIFEFEFTTGSGDNTQTQSRTVAAWSAAQSPLPGARLGGEPGFLMWRKSLSQPKPGSPPCKWQDPALVKLEERWFMVGSAETGGKFLTPAVREELASSPKKETWNLSGGWVACGYKNILNGENLGKFYGRGLRMLGVVR